MDGGLWSVMTQQYGQRVTLHDASGEREVKAFFQPVREKKAGEVPTALGISPRGLYLYLGPAEESLEGVSALEWESKRFFVLRHREVTVGERCLYQWAVAQEADEVSTYGAE